VDASRTTPDDQRFLDVVLTRLVTERRRSIDTIVLSTAGPGANRERPTSDLWRDRPGFTLVVADDGSSIATQYGRSDLVAIPSATVDGSIPALRAMAAGRPIVAADCPSIRDVVSTVRHGVLARPGRVDEWVDKLDYLLGEAAVRLHLGRGARLRAETTFALPRTLAQLSDRLDAVVSSWRYHVTDPAEG
jgi:hypothetical protein